MLLERYMKIVRCNSGMAALEFAVLAPALLMLVFSVIVYSIYFTSLYGVRHAASEGARAALAGLSSDERALLAEERAQEVIVKYSAIMGSSDGVSIDTESQGSDVFTVTVAYDMSGSPIMKYTGFLPLPSSIVSSSVKVTNGSY